MYIFFVVSAFYSKEKAIKMIKIYRTGHDYAEVEDDGQQYSRGLEKLHKYQNYDGRYSYRHKYTVDELETTMYDFNSKTFDSDSSDLNDDEIIKRCQNSITHQIVENSRYKSYVFFKMYHYSNINTIYPIVPKKKQDIMKKMKDICRSDSEGKKDVQNASKHLLETKVFPLDKHLSKGSKILLIDINSMRSIVREGIRHEHGVKISKKELITKVECFLKNQNLDKLQNNDEIDIKDINIMLLDRGLEHYSLIKQMFNIFDYLVFNSTDIDHIPDSKIDKFLIPQCIITKHLYNNLLYIDQSTSAVFSQFKIFVTMIAYLDLVDSANDEEYERILTRDAMKLLKITLGTNVLGELRDVLSTLLRVLTGYSESENECFGLIIEIINTRKGKQSFHHRQCYMRLSRFFVEIFLEINSSNIYKTVMDTACKLLLCYIKERCACTSCDRELESIFFLNFDLSEKDSSNIDANNFCIFEENSNSVDLDKNASYKTDSVLTLFDIDNCVQVSFTSCTVPDFFAITHYWSDSGISSNDDAISIIKNIQKDSSLKYAFFDILCVNQKNECEIAQATYNMSEIYMKAQKTYMLMKDDDSFGKWRDRTWTTQEEYFSKRLYSYNLRTSEIISMKDATKQDNLRQLIMYDVYSRKGGLRNDVIYSLRNLLPGVNNMTCTYSDSFDMVIIKMLMSAGRRVREYIGSGIYSMYSCCFLLRSSEHIEKRILKDGELDDKQKMTYYPMVGMCFDSKMCSYKCEDMTANEFIDFMGFDSEYKIRSRYSREELLVKYRWYDDIGKEELMRHDQFKIMLNRDIGKNFKKCTNINGEVVVFASECECKEIYIVHNLKDQASFKHGDTLCSKKHAHNVLLMVFRRYYKYTKYNNDNICNKNITYETISGRKHKDVKRTRENRQKMTKCALEMDYLSVVKSLKDVDDEYEKYIQNNCDVISEFELCEYYCLNSNRPLLRVLNSSRKFQMCCDITCVVIYFLNKFRKEILKNNLSNLMKIFNYHLLHKNVWHLNYLIMEQRKERDFRNTVDEIITFSRTPETASSFFDVHTKIRVIKTTTRNKKRSRRFKNKTIRFQLYRYFFTFKNLNKDAVRCEIVKVKRYKIQNAQKITSRSVLFYRDKVCFKNLVIFQSKFNRRLV